MRARTLGAGDLVVYRKDKHGTHPGRRASGVQPSPRGETYDYHVDKFWIVERRTGDTVHVRTPGGKHHELRLDDPRLRRPTLREWLWLRTRGRERLRSLRGARS